MIGRAFRRAVDAIAPSAARVARASPTRSAQGPDRARSPRGAGPAAVDASSPRRIGDPAPAREAAGRVAASSVGAASLARSTSGAGGLAADTGRLRVGAPTARVGVRRRPRTRRPPAVARFALGTTSRPPLSTAGSVGATAGSVVHVGVGVALDAAAGAGEACVGCSTRGVGGAGSDCTGAGAAAGAGAGTTTFARSGRNASGSR